MSFYIFINNGKIDGKGECPCSGENIDCIEVSKEIYDNYEQYAYINDEIVVNPEWDNIVLQKAKNEKISQNDLVRDEKLISGIKYQNVLFDSDTDQKVNLLATVGIMSDTDTIVWYGMDNQGLLCTKADLIAIGGLITELHSFCWQNNAYIKEQIENAQTIEEIEAIEISYESNI